MKARNIRATAGRDMKGQKHKGDGQGGDMKGQKHKGDGQGGGMKGQKHKAMAWAAE